MKIIISGYGQMGREIEKIALERDHQIIAIINSPRQQKSSFDIFLKADVVIDFSLPDSAYNNIIRYTKHNIPLVVGTTGWYKHLNEIKKYCIENGKSIFYSSNFSIGMNIVFEMNRRLASLLKDQPQYKLRIEETHHINKKDAPSGTAITLANDIISNYPSKKVWVNDISDNAEDLEIFSYRRDNVFGIHSVIYNSVFDEIELKHTAHSRKGFALGAVMAAEWLIGKKGFFTMNNMLNL